MSYTQAPRAFIRAGLAMLASVSLTLAAAAQPAQTGSIHGRVLDATTGSYLNNARVTIEGTQIEDFTNQFGEYDLPGVPAGVARLHVFYTGQPEQTLSVNVAAGQTATANVTFGGSVTSDNQVVKLDQFVVESRKDTDQKSIAINEQRFAPNIKSVVSTDQFGDITEGNIGEFVKFLPGVAVDYVAADVRNIMLRGLSPQYTSVTSDGLPMASAASSSASRVFELEQVSINNVSRMEVVFSRTPDIPAAALGGSVNLVSKSAFELNHPQFQYRVYGAMNSYYKQLGATPGPGTHPTQKIMTGADFTFADPVNDHFGYTLSVLTSHTRNPQLRTNPQWAPNGINKNYYDSVTKLPLVPETNPFLEKYQMQDGPKTNTRTAISGTADWKLSHENVLSFTAQDNFYDAPFYNRNFTFDTGGNVPASWGPTFTHGATGKGNANFGSAWRDKSGVTFNLGTKFVHTGPIWKIDGAVQYSHATNHYQDQNRGYFENVSYTLKNLTVNYDGYNGLKPGSVTAADSTGAPVNLYDVRNYTLANARFEPMDSEDVFKTVAANARRSFNFKFPTRLKFGMLIQEENRDIRSLNNSFNFVGPNAATAATTYNLLDTEYNQVTPPYSLPPVSWPSDAAAYNLFVTHPEYFTPAANNANQINEINGSLYLKERISSGYVMGDTRLMDSRIRTVYGIRFERTDDEGTGPLTQTVNKVTTHVYRGAHAAKHYGAGYPSVNVSFNITDNLILRAAYSRSIGRPELKDIIPNYTLPDPENTTGTQIIKVTNTSLVPEQANNYDLSLEYYFKQLGVVSANVFRKDFSNFYGSLTQPATVDLLNQFGVPDAQQYADAGAEIQSSFNVGDARVTGYGFSYQGKIAYGVSAFANATILHLQGSRFANFNNFISKSINWGLAYDNRRISAKLNWNYRGRERLGALNGFSDTSAYEYFKPRLYLDANLEYRISKHVGLFLNGRNITNVPQDDLRYGATTPVYAQLYRREMFGAVYTFGLKGTF